MTMSVACMSSPLGLIELVADERGISSLEFVNAQRYDTIWSPTIELAFAQLDEYFSGQRRQFDLPLDMHGSPFEMHVWEQLCKISYGQTMSYGDVACAIGNPRAARAVGLAVGKNPLAIIVPCHRVLGRDSKLVGYGGGLWRKAWLLKHEGCAFRE